MKLLSCHIENYGKISNTDINFEEGLTSLCEANGYGKTTLASFLKAMFYGLDTDRSKGNFNDRRHFYPFAGGNFGGHITFLWQGKTFKVERYFDEKSEVKDTVTVYCNGVNSPEYCENIGEQIFGIDKQSFERTVFITDTDIEISSTSNINTKLNNFLEGSNDDTNLNAALTRLDNKCKEYKKRQGNDLITLEKQKINDLSESISNAQAIAAGLQAKYARLDGINRRIKELSERLSAAQSVNVILKDWEHYDSLVALADSKQNEIAETESRYPYGVPSNDELERLSAALDMDRTLKAQGQNKLFTDGDEAKYSALRLKFEDGIPAEGELCEIENKIGKSDELAYAITSLKNVQPTEREGVIRQKFAYHVPTAAEVAELELKEQRYMEAEKKCASLPDFTASEAVPVKAGKFAPSAYLILILNLSALLLIGGVAMVFFEKVRVIGVILIVLSIVLLAVGIFLYFLNKKTIARNSTAASAIADNMQKAEAAKLRDSILNEIQAFLMPYGYTVGNGVAFAVASLKEDLKSYSEIIKTSEESNDKLARKTDEKRLLDGEISSFFAKYSAVGESFIGKLSALRSDIYTFKSLTNRKQSSAANESELQQKLSENRIHIYNFCQKYHVDDDKIDGKFKIILNDCNNYNNALKALNEQRNRVAEFRRDKQLEARPELEFIDIKALNEQLLKEQDDKNALFTEITGDEYEAEKLEDLKNERAEAKERLKEYVTTHGLLLKTMDSLNQADRNIKDKYVKPIRDQFLYYSSLLEKALGEKVTMDANFQIRYELAGKERSEKHLSSGQRSLCAFCFRLALIDNMYAEEKPFLILDDPFASLDEEHIQKVKALLSELSKKLQIIYLVCHGSRAM